MGKLVFIRKLKLKTMFLIFVGMLVGQLVLAQGSKTITGTITEPDGSTPLPGVAIMEKGTSNGTITDLDGNYSINVTDDNAVLIISFMGYETQEVAVSGQTSISASLVAKDETLDEVVIVGYGEIKKRDVTGSVGTLDEEALTERGVGNPMEAIQGNIAGVKISSSTGRLGDEFNITIRGDNSMSGDAKPLYVVDGVVTDGIDFLNPQDISRVDILKDASSTAIYGSRGSNGVVIVTTKNGSSAKAGVTVTYDSYYGVKKAARLPEMMDAEKWWYYHKSAYLATTNLNDPMSITPELLEEKVLGVNATYPITGRGQNSLLEQRALNNETFDWYDAVLQDGHSANNYISIAGMGENGTNYNIGIGMQNETGLLDKESLDKYTFKASVNHKVNDMFSVGTNLTIAAVDMEQGSDVAMRDAFRLSPLMTPYGLDGELYPQPGKLKDADGNYLVNKTSTYNPLLEIANSSDNTKKWNLLGNTYVEVKPLEWLTFKTTLSAGYRNDRRGQSWGELTNTGSSNGPTAQVDKSSNFNYTWDNQANINYTLNEDHNFNFMALHSIHSSTTDETMLYSRGAPFETESYNVGAGDQGTYNVNSDFVNTKLVSYAFRLDYSYKGKYLLRLSNRWDGSTLLAKGHKWESFPSIAVGWRVVEESFLQSQDVVSNLKLRISYGFTGNNIIDPYSTVNVLSSPMYYAFGDAAVTGWMPSKLANNILTWEKTKEYNVGLDFGFLNNRISGSIDYYDRLSDQLLMTQKLPIESGWAEIEANVGSVNNRGVEIGLNTVNIDNGLIKWETSFIFTKNTNEIKSLYGQSEADDVGNGWFIGESINSLYDYKFDGIWQANERDLAATYDQLEGQTKVVDQNGDGKIVAEDDKIILGTLDPDWTGSFNTRLTIANFDLSASIITSQGVFVYSQFHQNFCDTRDRGRQKLASMDWYIPANGAGVEPQYSNAYPQARNMGKYGRTTGSQNGVQNYKDASFVKVKNISLGYTFGENVLSKLKLKHLRVYFNVIDPFVFTDYEGYDPEWASADLELGRVGSVTYQFGLNLKF